MQTVRTATQKRLTAHLKTNTITSVRYLFGMPVAAVYLLALVVGQTATLPSMSGRFLLYCVAGGLAQIVATSLLVALFSLRSFAVGTTYAKTEGIQAAVLGAAFFGERVSKGGLLAVFVGAAGVATISMSGAGAPLPALTRAFRDRATFYGVASGALFALAALFIRKASQLLDAGFALQAATTLVVMVGIQATLMGAYLLVVDRGALRAIARNLRPCMLTGITSAVGSIGWFTAMALQNAAYVKTVGQVELLFSLAVSTFVFKEKLRRSEVGGMALVVMGILLLLLWR